MSFKIPFIKRNRISVFERFEINWSDVATELDSWKDGQRGYLNLTKRSLPKSPEQLGYYYAVILPTAYEAFKKASADVSLVLHFKGKETKVDLNERTVDMFLKIRYAEYIGYYKDKADMNMAECSAYEDWAIKWLATWLNCHIPQADKNWNETTPVVNGDENGQ
jgi:hypothetical protein